MRIIGLMDDLEVAEIPDSLPVMILSGVTLFPHGYMPLFIFEERYRDMLRHALEHQRMFCVGHARPGIDHDEHPELVYPVTTAGLVRACVTHDDGTSHLMLSGLQRVEITGWEQDGPFRIASVNTRSSHITNRDAVTELAHAVVDLCSRLCDQNVPMTNQLREHLRGIRDPAALSDVVAQNFVNDPFDRQVLLETIDVHERLKFLAHHLSYQAAKDQG